MNYKLLIKISLPPLLKHNMIYTTAQRPLLDCQMHFYKLNLVLRNPSEWILQSTGLRYSLNLGSSLCEDTGKTWEKYWNSEGFDAMFLSSSLSHRDAPTPIANTLAPEARKPLAASIVAYGVCETPPVMTTTTWRLAWLTRPLSVLPRICSAAAVLVAPPTNGMLLKNEAKWFEN